MWETQPVARAMTRRSRSRLIAAVSFALLVGGCSVSPAGSLEPAGVPRASAPATTGSQATATGNPVDRTASAAVSGLADEPGWYRVAAPFGDPSTATWLDGVVAWQSQFVAFGRVKAPGRNQFDELAAVFLSDTGETWRPVPIDAGVGPGDTSEISLLAGGPRGMVVFGGTCCGAQGRAIWYSPDGRAWERVALEPSVFDGSEIAAVRAGDSGFVAVGSRSGRAAIWRSDDGRTWTSVGGAAAGLGRGAIADVAAVHGRLLAVGSQDDGKTYDGALWESPDGADWRRLPTDRLFRGELDTVFGRLYATPNGLLLIGYEGSHAERVQCEQSGADCGWGVETHWWSSDGRSWERLPPVRPAPGEPPLTGPGPLEFRLITAGGPGLVNLGEGRSGVVRLWASPDGREWQDLERGEVLRSGQDMASGIAVLNGKVVAVGDAWDMNSGEPSEPGVWIGPGL